MTDAANPTGQNGAPEEPLELRRHWRTIRSNWPLVLAVAVPITLLVLVLSLVLPSTYTARARIVLEDTPGLQTDSVDATQRQLSTLQTLLTSRDVLVRAALRLKGEDADSLAGKVSASVDPTANFINVVGTDNRAGQAAAIANAVSAAFLSKRRETDRLRLARSRTALLEALRRLEGSSGVDSTIERQALQERLSEVNISQATAGSDLQLAQLARPPKSPSSPKPVRNTIFALAAGLFLGVLAALARGQLAPKIGSARELSGLVGLPILAVVPRRTRFHKARWERDRAAAYANLQAALQLHLNGRQEVVLLTSAVPDEGKTELTAELGRTLAASGLKTLLVSADLRRPTLHESFGVEPSPGLGDLLRQGTNGGQVPAGAATVLVQDGAAGELALLPSGTAGPNAGALLTGGGLGRVFDDIGRSDFRYVIVDAPPLIAPVDVEALTREVHDVVLVVRVDRVTPDAVVEARDTLGRLGANVVGMVVVGADAPTYY